MTEARLVCGKCGRAKERTAALKSGWLEHQIEDAPEGYLIIRCPDHITGHALRLAGLPQQKGSKRVADNLDRGLWCEYGAAQDDYSASVHETDDNDGLRYVISYHRGRMPAFSARAFASVPALIQAMRRVQPDLRRWKLVKE